MALLMISIVVQCFRNALNYIAYDEHNCARH